MVHYDMVAQEIWDVLDKMEELSGCDLKSVIKKNILKEMGIPRGNRREVLESFNLYYFNTGYYESRLSEGIDMALESLGDRYHFILNWFKLEGCAHLPSILRDSRSMTSWLYKHDELLPMPYDIESMTVDEYMIQLIKHGTAVLCLTEYGIGWLKPGII